MAVVFCEISSMIMIHVLPVPCREGQSTWDTRLNATLQQTQGVDMRDDKLANKWQATELQVEGP